MAGFKTDTIDKAIIAFIMLVVLFKLYSVLMPEAQSAGNELNASGAPLGSFFVSNGIVFVLIMAGLVIFVVREFTHKK